MSVQTLPPKQASAQTRLAPSEAALILREQLDDTGLQLGRLDTQIGELRDLLHRLTIARAELVCRRGALILSLAEAEHWRKGESLPGHPRLIDHLIAGKVEPREVADIDLAEHTHKGAVHLDRSTSQESSQEDDQVVAEPFDGLGGE